MWIKHFSPKDDLLVLGNFIFRLQFILSIIVKYNQKENTQMEGTLLGLNRSNYTHSE